MKKVQLKQDLVSYLQDAVISCHLFPPISPFPNDLADYSSILVSLQSIQDNHKHLIVPIYMHVCICISVYTQMEQKGIYRNEKPFVHYVILVHHHQYKKTALCYTRGRQRGMALQEGNQWQQEKTLVSSQQRQKEEKKT